MRFSSQISTSDVFIITILLFSPLVTSIATVTKQQAIDATLTNVTVSQINSTSPIPVQRKHPAIPAQPHAKIGTKSTAKSVKKHKIVATPTLKKRMALNMTPTPPPVAEGSPSRTVFVNPEAKEFALFLPRRGQLVSESESEATSYCSNTADPSCAYQQPFPEGLIESVNFDSDPATEGPPAWIQATGCLKSDNGYVDPKDDGGQYDIRYPDGAQCTFGGYGASFIQLLEPGANRFCIRCCREANDQVNCNSHQDTQGCLTAIPGRYPAACAQ